MTHARTRRVLVTLGFVLLTAIPLGCGRKARPPVRVPILMYHKIGDVDDKWWVSTADLDAQMRSLHEQGYTTVLPSDLATRRKLSDKPVIITFDDGYLNAMTEAEPIIAKYGFQGIVYLITGLVGDNPDERKTYEGVECLTWDEVCAMQSRGTMTFGGHTRNDVNLARPGDHVEELKACYDDIATKGGFQPDSFCYPHGQYRPESPEQLATAGFSTAMTCMDDVAVTSGELKLLELPRLHMIGGEHVYHVARLDDQETNQEIIFRVAKKGELMRMALCLRWENDTENPQWIEPFVLGPERMVVTWPIESSDRKKEPFTLEFWDAHRVIRFHPPA